MPATLRSDLRNAHLIADSRRSRPRVDGVFGFGIPSPDARQYSSITILVEFIASSVLPAATAAGKTVLRAAGLVWTPYIAEWRGRDPTSRRCHARAGCAGGPAGLRHPRHPR
jgi:hypothetical protein